jgi:thiosulfate reductase cytochrome b subunit
MATSKKIAGNYVSWAFVCLVLLYGAIAVHKPAIGLAGLGGIMILGSLQALANKDEIWNSYKKSYKKPKSELMKTLNEPKLIYYQLNVYVLMPLMLVLGLAAIWTAWLLA